MYKQEQNPCFIIKSSVLEQEGSTKENIREIKHGHERGGAAWDGAIS